MKVYIITSGSYSDYTIRRVFLDKAKAEKWVSYNSQFEVNIIEEFDSSDETIFHSVTKVLTWLSRFNGKITKGCFIEHMSSEELTEKPSIQYRIDRIGYEVDNELAIIRILSDNKLSEEELEKKYTKICYDLLGQIDNLILNESWTIKMINAWLNIKE